jgi:hypothetical protein
MARSIESPGVEIREIDLSLNASLPVGTNVMVAGFAPQGPTDELINVTSMSELDQIYGAPQTAAERYFYHTCRQVIQSPGNLLCTRFPYGLSGGAGYGTTYSALLFPVSGYTYSGTVSGNALTTYTAATSFEIGVPTLINVTDAELAAWEAGQINWAVSGGEVVMSEDVSAAGNAGIIVINDFKTTIDDKYAGYYLGIMDNTNVGDTTYDKIRNVKYELNDTWNAIATTRLNFNLTGTDITDSLSEDIEKSVDSYGTFDADNWKDCVSIGLFKIRESIYADQLATVLDYVPTEYHIGSLDSRRREVEPGGTTQSTFFVAGKVNQDSTFLKMMVNPNISERGGSWTGSDGLPSKTVRMAAGVDSVYAIGPVVAPTSLDNKKIGNLPSKLDRALILAENKEQIPIDLVCEGGLGTVWAKVRSRGLTGAVVNANDAASYDDTEYLYGIIEDDASGKHLDDPTDGSSCDVQDNWETIFNAFQVFCGQTRKDCLFISDPVRHIFVQGRDAKVLDNRDNNFSSNVYYALKNLYAASNSNYACTYGNWVKRFDNALGDFIWLPFSGWAANIMATMDSNLQPWYAPAGLNNGIVRDIVDIGINPNQKQRDLLYRISVNPVVFFPGDGYTIWGQKTLQRKPSAFDRINVRRLFLVLEKATLAIMRYFVFEPNTIFTRTRVVNVLTPIFEIPKNNEGLYDYLIVCDERNNTPDVIDRNELVVDIYLKPVRTAEFILCNFIATRTDADFTELL